MKFLSVKSDGIALITKLIKTIMTALKLYNTRGGIYTSTKSLEESNNSTVYN